MNADITNLLLNVEKYLPDIQMEFNTYQKEFFSKRSPQFFCLELNGEAGELANLEKKAWKGREISVDDLADEAADVFIALMNYSNSRNISLGSAVKHKLEWIESKRQEIENLGIKY